MISGIVGFPLAQRFQGDNGVSAWQVGGRRLDNFQVRWEIIIVKHVLERQHTLYI